MQLFVGRGHDAISATTLCQIQRLISLSECILKTLIGLRCRHTKAGCYCQRIFRNEVCFHYSVPQLLSQFRCLCQRRTGTDENKFLTSPATQSIGIACMCPQNFAHGLQDTIANMVSTVIVYSLEVIEINDDDAGGQFGGPQRFDELLDTVAIQNLGEPIER